MTSEHDTSRQFARQNYEEFLAEAGRRLEVLSSIEQALLKATFAVNGGGIIAFLTFLGNSQKGMEPRAAFWALLWLGIGLAFALFAAFFAYISNRAYHSASVSDAWQAQAEMHDLEEDHSSTEDMKIGDRFEMAFSLAIGLSTLLFLVGIFVALDAIT